VYRYVNDLLWKYCDGVPEFVEQPRDISIHSKEAIEEACVIPYYPCMHGGKCGLNPETCGRCLTNSMLPL